MIDSVIVGRINGLFGTHGWVKVLSYTRPRENLLTYQPWHLQLGTDWQEYQVRAARRHHGGLIASLTGVDDRDAAAQLLRRDVAIERAQLAKLDEGEYYWTDLIGLHVVNLQNEDLGQVKAVLETGANDVLHVQGESERFIPFVPGIYVADVNLDSRQIRVDWHIDD